MPALEIIGIVIAAVGAWADVFLSVFELCMEGTCRSECCGIVEMEHDGGSSRESLRPVETRVDFQVEIAPQEKS